MKVAIIGATGFLGSRLVKEAVSRGLNVTAIARNADKVTDNQVNADKVTDNQVNKVSVDVNNVDELAGGLAGHDVVISAFNAGWTNPDIYDDFIAGSTAIQQAVKKADINRLIVVGGAGSLFISENQQLIDTPEFPAVYKPGASAARDYLNMLKEEKDLDWAFFSPAIEMNAGITTGRTGKYRLGKDYPVFDENNVSRLSGEDVAVVILDEVEKPQHHQERFTAAY